MSPDQKHMAEKSNKDTNDLNLVPFKSPMPSNMMPVGWIPIFSFNNMTNANNNPFPAPNFSNLYNPNMNNNMPSFGNINSNMGSNMSSNNPNNFPSDENIDNLYSYNKSNYTSSNPGSMSSSSNMGSSTNMGSSNNPGSMNSPNINRSENISDVLRNYTADLDEDVDLCRHCLDKRIDKVYKKIQEKDPEIISMLVENYNIPCPIAKIIVRKIIKLSLQYCKKAGD